MAESSSCVPFDTATLYPSRWSATPFAPWTVDCLKPTCPCPFIFWDGHRSMLFSFFCLAFVSNRGACRSTQTPAINSSGSVLQRTTILRSFQTHLKINDVIKVRAYALQPVATEPTRQILQCSSAVLNLSFRYMLLDAYSGWCNTYARICLLLLFAIIYFLDQKVKVTMKWHC